MKIIYMNRLIIRTRHYFVFIKGKTSNRNACMGRKGPLLIFTQKPVLPCQEFILILNGQKVVGIPFQNQEFQKDLFRWESVGNPFPL
jgi:hypothetical protein